MKTEQQLITEARRIEQLGRMEWERYPRPHPASSDLDLAEILVLYRFPSVTSEEREANDGPVLTRRIERRIEIELDAATPEFSLVTEEVVTDADGQVVRHEHPDVSSSSESAFDVLSEGQVLTDYDQLGCQLLPLVERMESRDFGDPTSADDIAEVERIVEAGVLPATDRLRIKAEIVEFLEGRLEAGAFVTHVIDRHFCREGRCETVTERHGHRITIEEP
ncbi:hypothetical protein OPIT5_06205 [Opitutaceae bacterium TAV5]|nr:hypothetical protein OPIT5_06205 [Opitutaceae bacterium TAV5]